jgi:hypothetical protein
MRRLLLPPSEAAVRLSAVVVAEAARKFQGEKHLHPPLLRRRRRRRRPWWRVAEEEGSRSVGENRSRGNLRHPVPQLFHQLPFLGVQQQQEQEQQQQEQQQKLSHNSVGWMLR